MYRRFVAIAASTAVALTLFAGPALATHDHFIVTPNGECHQVAAGQTSIDDPSHGGDHRFHDNVHSGASADAKLGKGNSKVELYSRATAPTFCFEGQGT